MTGHNEWYGQTNGWMVRLKGWKEPTQTTTLYSVFMFWVGMASKTALSDNSTVSLTVQGHCWTILPSMECISERFCKTCFQIGVYYTVLFVCTSFEWGIVFFPRNHQHCATFIVCSVDAHCQNLIWGFQ